MEPELWRKIEDLFHAALEQQPEVRQAFLTAACKGDTDLQRQVELLLHQEQQAGSFMEAAALTSTGAAGESLLGLQFGPYRIVSPLGAGGMGEVYRAHDSKLGRDVAIKTLPPEFARDPDRLARFRREARTLASLNHPNIAAIYGLEESGGVDCLVLELVEGDALQGPLPIAQALDYARQVAEALSAAHDKGIIHRDLKPANVKVTPQGRVKVLDFGLAKAIWAPDRDQDLSQLSTVTGVETLAGHIVGTPGYMSPEQARGKEVDKRTDIWAFGCLLYELLTGQRAFQGETPSDTIAAVLEREPSWSALPAKTPAKISELLQRCLQKDANRRLADLAAAVKAIEEVQKASTRTRRTGRKGMRSLAVLPLVNLSGDAEHEYFADGMTDALITTLAQIGSLRVISRTSVMQYKGARKPLPEIARELNVEVVLEGTVLRFANRVRIAAQLIDAPSDMHIWAKNYESGLEDILVLQSEVAQSVAHEIKITLTPQERARFSATRAVDTEAYEAFLKGRFYWYKRTPQALSKSVDSLQLAIAKDATYPLAHAGLADTYCTLGWDLFAISPPAEAFPKARQSAQKALELDPNCAEAYAALGWASTAYDWDWITAEKAFRRAIELKPQYAPAHMWYSHLLHAMNRVDDAFEHGRLAIDCDPLGVILNVHLGWHLTYHREYEGAVEQLQKALDLEPSFILARLFLGEAYEHMGRFDEAIAEFEKAVDFSGRRPVYVAGLGHAYAVSGRRDSALKIIDELEQLSRGTYVAARGIAEIYVGLGDKPRAFNWLDRALEQRNGWLFHINTNPRYDSLRSDRRYAELARRIGLP